MKTTTLGPHPMNADMAVVRASGRVVGMRRKVVILGAAGKSLRTAPLRDPAWEVWGLNACLSTHLIDGALRADRWFQLHPLDRCDPDEVAWAEICPVPTYVVSHPDPGVPSGVPYPLDAILQMPGARRWFASTFSYQVALAVLDGFEEIGLYGVELPQGTMRERLLEHASLAWWAGYAAGRGIRVTIPPESALFDHPFLYGIEYDDERLFGQCVTRDAVLAGISPTTGLPRNLDGAGGEP